GFRTADRPLPLRRSNFQTEWRSTMRSFLREKKNHLSLRQRAWEADHRAPPQVACLSGYFRKNPQLPCRAVSRDGNAREKERAARSGGGPGPARDPTRPGPPERRQEEKPP